TLLDRIPLGFEGFDRGAYHDLYHGFPLTSSQVYLDRGVVHVRSSSSSRAASRRKPQKGRTARRSSGVSQESSYASLGSTPRLGGGREARTPPNHFSLASRSISPRSRSPFAPHPFLPAGMSGRKRS